MSLAIGASLNQGNSEKGTNNSSASSISQKPCLETFVISTSKVLAPGSTDVIFVFPDQRLRRPNLAVVQDVILRQFDQRLKPELSFPIGMIHVHVEPWFLAREEKEPEAILAKIVGLTRFFFPAPNALLSGAREDARTPTPLQAYHLR